MGIFTNRFDYLFKNATHNLIVQLFRYGIVGGISFIVDFGLLAFFTEVFDMPYLVSACVSFIGGLIANYTLSIRWVFGSTERDAAARSAEFIIFAVIGVIGLGLNALIMWISTEMAGVHYLLSKIISTIIVFIWNFMARRVMISQITLKWKRNRQQPSRQQS